MHTGRTLLNHPRYIFNSNHIHALIMSIQSSCSGSANQLQLSSNLWPTYWMC